MNIAGFVDAHCHAFQRALRGRDRGGDFWAWRDGMLELAASLTVEDVRRQYVHVYRALREHGLRPIELLDREGCLGPHTTAVHATHADGHELDLLAAAGARICVCPTTEANLGDGFLPVARVCHRSIGLCIGSDSNVRIDPLEELRELEGIARRRTLRRNVISPDTLLCFGSDEGAAALGLDAWPEINVDLTHPSLAGLDEADVFGALVFGCSADVFV